MPNLSQQIYASRVRLGEIVPELSGWAIQRQLVAEVIEATAALAVDQLQQAPATGYPDAPVRALLLALASLARNAGHDLEEDLAQWTYALAAQKKAPPAGPVQRAPTALEIQGGIR